MAQAIDPAVLIPIAEKYGIDPAAFIKAAEIESSLGATPDTPGSQYQGLFQLGPDEAARWGGLNRADPMQNAEMAARGWSQDIVPQLTASLGRDPTWAEVYLAHQQGVAGATHMIQNPNAPAASGPVTRDAVAGNIPGNVRSQYDPSTMTGKQFADLWLPRFDGSTVASASRQPGIPDMSIPALYQVPGYDYSNLPVNGMTAMGGPAGSMWDVPHQNAQAGPFSQDQLDQMLGGLSGRLGLMPDTGTPSPGMPPAGNYFYPPEMPQGQPYFGPTETADGYHYPPAADGGQPYFGTQAVAQAQPEGSSPYLPIPSYSGSYPGAGGFQPADVQSFPALGGHVDQVASGYDPTNPPQHDLSDTTGMLAWSPLSIFGGNQPGANAEPQYPPDPTQNWRDPQTGTYIFGSNALASMADAANKATDAGQDPMKAVFNDTYTSAPDSHISDLKQLGADIEQGQKVGQAGSDFASNPLWASLGGAASDIAGMVGPFMGGGGQSLTPAANAYAETPATNEYDKGKDPTTALDAVNWMGQGGLGLGNDPAALQFGGFSPMGEPFDPNADPFGAKPDKQSQPGPSFTPQAPAYTSPISPIFGNIPTGGAAGWASFGSGTLNGQPWSLGSTLPPIGSGIAPDTKTRQFTAPVQQAMPAQAGPASQPIIMAPTVNPFLPPPGMSPDYGGIFQAPGMVGPSFDPGSFASQDAESLASAATAQDQSGAKTALCSYFMRKGRIPKEVWKAETRYSYRFSSLMRNGYHVWAKPCVRAMEQGGLLGTLLDKALFPVAFHWAREMAYRQGVGERGSRLGAMFHVIIGGLSYALGWLMQPNKIPQEDF